MTPQEPQADSDRSSQCGLPALVFTETFLTARFSKCQAYDFRPRMPHELLDRKSRPGLLWIWHLGRRFSRWREKRSARRLCNVMDLRPVGTDVGSTERSTTLGDRTFEPRPNSVKMTDPTETES